MNYAQELKQLKDKDLFRTPAVFDHVDAIHMHKDGKELINFASNDYLGLSHDPRIIAAAEKALKEYGLGAGASRLVCGTQTIHDQLEKRIATFKKKERAAPLGTVGYRMAGTKKPASAIAADTRRTSEFSPTITGIIDDVASSVMTEALFSCLLITLILSHSFVRNGASLSTIAIASNAPAQTQAGSAVV